MPTKAQLLAAYRKLHGKKKTSKKKTTGKKKKPGTALAAYRRKIKNAPGVKTNETRIKKLESELKKTKAAKAKAVKAAQKKYSHSKK